MLNCSQEFASTLNVLLEVVLKMYFADMVCLMHLRQISSTEALDQQVGLLRDIPLCTISVYQPQDIRYGRLESALGCAAILVTFANASLALEHIEHELQVSSGQGYNRRPYIVVLETDVNEFFSSTALHFIRDLLVIVADADDQGTYLLYTHKFIGRDNNEEAVLLAKWFAVNQSFVPMENVFRELGLGAATPTLFPDKVSNMHGRHFMCQIIETEMYALTDENLGSELMVFEQFLHHFNLTRSRQSLLPQSIYKVGSENRNQVEQESYSALLSDDPTKSIDIVFGGFPGGTRSQILFDLVAVTYCQQSIIVPLPKPRPGWLLIFHTFNWEVWAFYCSGLGLILAVITITSQWEARAIGSPAILAADYICLLCFGQPLPNMGPSRRIRYLLAVSLWCAMHFSAMFNSGILRALVVPLLEDDVRTAEDLAISHLTIYDDANWLDFLSSDSRVVYREIYRKAKVIEDMQEMAAMFKLKTTAFAVSEFETKYVSSGWLGNVDRSDLAGYQRLEDNIAAMNTFYILRKHSVFTRQLEAFVQRVRASGLLLHWETEYLIRTGSLRDQITLMSTPAPSHSHLVQLRMQHLQGAFALLIIGHLVALFRFLFEVNLLPQLLVLLLC